MCVCCVLCVCVWCCCVCVCVCGVSDSDSPVITYYETYYRFDTGLLKVFYKLSTQISPSYYIIMGAMLVVGASKILILLIIFRSIMFQEHYRFEENA